ncbi:MAG TPA: hypothetical protein DDX71_02945 [Ruminococcus sp.]|nr:hypothetical protein [Ruminococcus sp.]
MKRITAAVLSAAAFAAFSAPMSAAAAADSVRITVEICTRMEDNELAPSPLTVCDADRNGTIDVYDAMYLAHERYFPDSAANSGFWDVNSTFVHELYDKNGRMRCVNQAAAEAGTEDPRFRTDLQEGDSLTIYAQDIMSSFIGLEILNGEMQQYSLADPLPTGTTLTVRAMQYETYVRDPKPASGITLLLNGSYAATTDQDGKAALTFGQAGKYALTARQDDSNVYPIDIRKADQMFRVRVNVYDDAFAVQPKTTSDLLVYDFNDDGEVDLNDAMTLARAANLCRDDLDYTGAFTEAAGKTVIDPANHVIFTMRPAIAETTAATTGTVQTSDRTSAASSAETSVKTASAASSAAAKTASTTAGNVKTGDAMPAAALILAALAASGAAVVTAAKRGEQ